MHTVTAGARSHAASAYDRVFYSAISIVMALTVVAGFGPTYYFAGASARTLSGGSLTTTVQLHGVLFSAWVLLFIVQTALVAQRRVAVHRRLGIAGVALAVGMLVAGYNTAVSAVARGAAPLGIDPLTFFAIPIFDLVLFAGFVTAAVAMRRNREAHKRLMLLAYVSIIPAAIARLPGIQGSAPLVFFGMAFVFVLAGAIYDRWSRGRIHRAYLIGGAIFLLSVPLRLAISGTAAWHTLAAALVG